MQPSHGTLSSKGRLEDAKLMLLASSKELIHLAANLSHLGLIESTIILWNVEADLWVPLPPNDQDAIRSYIGCARCEPASLRCAVSKQGYLVELYIHGYPGSSSI